jgi:hypothetical protein
MPSFMMSIALREKPSSSRRRRCSIAARALREAVAIAAHDDHAHELCNCVGHERNRLPHRSAVGCERHHQLVFAARREFSGGVDGETGNDFFTLFAPQLGRAVVLRRAPLLEVPAVRGQIFRDLSSFDLRFFQPNERARLLVPGELVGERRLQVLELLPLSGHGNDAVVSPDHAEVRLSVAVGAAGERQLTRDVLGALLRGDGFLGVLFHAG